MQFGLERRGRILLADEMGAGKSVQALALASCYIEEWPLLIIAPAAMRMVWAEQIEIWLPRIRPRDILVIEKSENAPWLQAERKGGAHRVTVVSYEMLQRLTCDACKDWRRYPVSGGARPMGQSVLSGCQAPHCMAAMGWKVVVVDESHCLRLPRGLSGNPRTVAALRVIRSATRAMLLTGTPSLSKPFDMWAQIDALKPNLLGPKEAFGLRYCFVSSKEWVIRRDFSGRPVRNELCTVVRFTGGRHLAELHGLLCREVMIRRLKEEVISQVRYPNSSRR